MRSSTIGIGFGILGAGLFVPAQQAKSWPKFSQDVAPTFKAACISCHAGKDAAADLDLTKPELLVKNGMIKVGDPEHSTLIRRMKGLDGLPAMPKGFKPVAAEKIKLIEDWIRGGAKIDGGAAKHWAYQAPTVPAIPVLNLKWGNNLIDTFVLDKMIEHKLTPSAEAPKEILARRLYLDLTGLPPTVEEVDTFLNDKSPKAYENLVDKLLASKHYGERQARMWLDISRYADTNGYEADRIRTAYVYRDWVINAFNSNMPYSEFTIKQLAGDMLPNATDEDKIATGFHRNSMFNEEGGVDPAESFYNVVIDRVTTTSTTWLGSTLQCARCHDHKFDPFTQKDFFKFYAVFGNASYRRDGDYSKTYSEHWIEPSMKVMTSDTKVAIENAKKKLLQADLNKANYLASHADELAKWKVAASQPIEFENPKFLDFVSVGGAKVNVTSESILEVSGKNSDNDEYKVQLQLPSGEFTGMKVETLPADGIPAGRASSQNFVMTEIALGVDGLKIPFTNAQADFVQEGYDLAKLLKGDRNSGWAIYPQANVPHRMVVQFAKPISGSKAVVTFGFHSVWKNHNLGRFRVSFTKSPYPLLAAGPTITAKTPASQVESAFFLSNPTSAPIQAERDAAERDLKSIQDNLPTALVMQDKPVTGKLTSPVHHRGEFLSQGELVEAGTPAVLPGPKSAVNMNRLELAKWLVDGRNPLTARVEVNRIWEQYFGRGIVETMDDFGTQGSPPSNQPLLDWLAIRFMKSGWDIKAMHKLIVMSATYRQSSAASKIGLDRDPTNLFLSRGPRFRLEAEMIRDTALQASGLLNPKVGGPSIMPYQPDGIWDSPYNGEQWMETKNEDRYRRGLYVFTKRTAMYPSFTTFDAGTRETCSVRRIRTNTPLQALALLNDKAYLEAAQALGRKMMQRGSLEQGLVYGFRATTSRKPSRAELTVLAKAFTNFREKYTKDTVAAKKLGKDEREAAWTMVGNVLLNLDETITKE